MSGGGLEIRRMRDGDLPAVLALLGTSLHWGKDARYRELFAWKHENGVFGPSPAWVALDGEQIVGFRVLLRWEFEHRGSTVRAVRPVDTATDSAYRGQGIFTRLTMQALDEVRAEGVELVFNTPNLQSRPGYLKMGWRVVGQLAAVARPTRPWRAGRMIGARTPADRWTLESEAGLAAAEVLEDCSALETLLARRTTSVGLRTRLTPEFLAWRYGEALLGYRAIVEPDGIEGGLAIFRVRRRGRAREAVLCEVLVPHDEPRVARRLVRRLTASVDADYVLGIRTAAGGTDRLWRMPGQGPVLTARSLTDAAPPDQDAWALTLGDVELF